jgi:IclR family transcriptional regulator, acetate operon repressor
MKSFVKIKDALCAVAEEPGIGLSELGRRLGLPKSTAHRVLQALESADFVRQVADGKYVLGSLVFELASGDRDRLRLVELARPLMFRLREDWNETVALHVRKGDSWITLEQVESTQELRRTISNLGVPNPLHAAATGKLFLSFLDEEERQRYFQDHRLIAVTSKTLTNKSDLQRELDTIRRRGFATSHEELVPGVAGIAVPVSRPDGSVAAALAFSGPVVRFTPRNVTAMRDLLAGAAAELADALGLQNIASPAGDAPPPTPSRKRKASNAAPSL